MTVLESVLSLLFPVGLLANAVAAALLRWGVARPRAKAGSTRCPECGYSHTGLARGTPCPECGRTRPEPTRGEDRRHAAATLWMTAGVALGVTFAYAGGLAFLVWWLRNWPLNGLLALAPVFLAPAALLAATHVVFPNVRGRRLRRGQTAGVAVCTAIGGLAAALLFSYDDLTGADSASGGILFVFISIPAASGIGYGALVAMLGSLVWEHRRSRT